MPKSNAWWLAIAAFVAAVASVTVIPNVKPNSPREIVDIPLVSGVKLPAELSGFLKYKTVGAVDAFNHVPENNTNVFAGAHKYLQRTFPLVWARLDVTTVSDWSLIIHWKGIDASLKPAALLSHIDVVPADDSSTTAWSYPPWGGHIVNGHIYGRGALDLKSNVIAMLHAVNQLLTEGFRPQRSLYLLYGHDEETGGSYGALQIVKELQKQDVQFSFVLDEGGLVIRDGLPPLSNSPIALVGTAEKDYSVVAIEATSPGGHASMPNIDGTSVGATLARIVTAIDRSPPPVQLQAPTTHFLHALADAAPVRSLAWLLRNAHNRFVAAVLGRLLALSADTAALARTTAALTKLEAGHTYNVLPQTGRAIYNFRHLPGHSIEQVIDYVWSRIAKADRGRVSVKCLDERHASSHISPPDGPHFQLLARIIKETFARPQEPMLVAPYLVVAGQSTWRHCAGGTDSKLYSPLSKHIYRFQPIAIDRKAGDLSSVHGTNERISIKDLEIAAKFFLHLIKSSSQAIQGE